jgi:hypothetical protein
VLSIYLLRDRVHYRIVFPALYPALYSVIPALYPVIPAIYSVIPAEAGIQSGKRQTCRRCLDPRFRGGDKA